MALCEIRERRTNFHSTLRAYGLLQDCPDPGFSASAMLSRADAQRAMRLFGQIAYGDDSYNDFSSRKMKSMLAF
jgi:hypothetical protein